ncbi:MAG: sterol desaturase family protein [Kofleriaceae bacterium]|nr:sterol desaturase family protein [Kofleriaceae bacterium]
MPESTILTVLFAAAAILAGAFLVILPIELIWLRRRGALTWARLKEMLASASPTAIALLVEGVSVALALAVFGAVAELSPWEIPITWWSALLGLIAVDFLYYWDHRAGHRIRLYWAVSHSVHHSSPHYDQTTGLRVSFVDGFIAPLFYWPLALIGFPPILIVAVFAVSIAYQQWIHTEAIGKLRWLDPWLNTPSNHRVHHGSQPGYLDKNYGGVLMIWDRLFGTYTAETEPVRFGLTRPIESANPWVVHTAELTRLAKDLQASTPAVAWSRLWRGPEWCAPARPPV